MPSLIAYLTLTFLLVITPGSTTAVVVRSALAGGRAAGLAAALGAALGNTSHATAAGLGLAVLVARWPLALTIVRVGGALYLAWLGLVSLSRALRNADGGLPFSTNASASADERRGSFRQGLTVNLLSPAIVTFYLVVVPSFLPAGAPRWTFAGLAAIHIVMAFACHSLWAVAFDTLRQWFRSSRARRGLEGLTGLALLALAASVIAQQK